MFIFVLTTMPSFDIINLLELEEAFLRMIGGTMKRHAYKPVVKNWNFKQIGI